MTGPVVAIHQPQYLPWLQYFAKAAACDILVHLDNVQFQRRGYQNRNMVKTPHGPRWLTVPVTAGRDTRIADVGIADQHWVGTHVTTLSHAYGKAPYFGWLRDELTPLLQSGADKLVDLNIATTAWALQRFGITCRVVRASELDVAGAKDDLIIAICKAVGAGVYYSGTGAQAYQEAAKFEAAGIELRYQSFTHPAYTQVHADQGFIKDLAAIDLLANMGPASRDILLGAAA